MEGHVGGYTNALLATAYSRGAEVRADRFSMALLRDAAVAPGATAAFFRRLSKDADGTERMFAYVATHPVSSDRAKSFAASAVKGAAYRPLDEAQWAALRNICEGQSAKFEWRI